MEIFGLIVFVAVILFTKVPFVGQILLAVLILLLSICYRIAEVLEEDRYSCDCCCEDDEDEEIDEYEEDEEFDDDETPSTKRRLPWLFPK